MGSYCAIDQMFFFLLLLLYNFVCSGSALCLIALLYIACSGPLTARLTYKPALVGVWIVFVHAIIAIWLYYL